MIEDKKEKINNDSSQKAKLLAICAILLTVVLFAWIAYSFWGFWGQWQKSPQNTEADSYIDKTGLSEVKSILEERK